MSDADFSFFQLVWSSRIESEKLDWIVFFANDITIKVRVLKREHKYEFTVPLLLEQNNGHYSCDPFSLYQLEMKMRN